jgi:hypothetical protein
LKARTGVQASETPTISIIRTDKGVEAMNLMISEIASRLTPAATHADATVDTIPYAIGECALGLLLVARSVSGVCGILIDAGHDELEADLAARFSRSQAHRQRGRRPRRSGEGDPLRGQARRRTSSPAGYARDVVPAPRLGEAARVN